MSDIDEDIDSFPPSFSHKGTDLRTQQLVKGYGKPTHITAAEAVERGKHKFVAKKDENAYKGMIKPLTILKRGSVDKLTESKIIAGNAPTRTHTIDPKLQTFVSTVDPTGDTDLLRLNMLNLKPKKEKSSGPIQFNQTGAIEGDSQVFHGHHFVINPNEREEIKSFQPSDQRIEDVPVYLPKTQPTISKPIQPSSHSGMDMDQQIYYEDTRPSRPGMKRDIGREFGLRTENIEVHKPTRFAMPWNPQPPSQAPTFANEGVTNNSFHSNNIISENKQQPLDSLLLEPDLFDDLAFHQDEINRIHKQKEVEALIFDGEEFLEDPFLPVQATVQNRYQRSTKNISNVGLEKTAFLPNIDKFQRIVDTKTSSEFNPASEDLDAFIPETFNNSFHPKQQQNSKSEVPLSIENAKTFIPWKHPKPKAPKSFQSHHVGGADSKNSVHTNQIKGILKKNQQPSKIVQFNETDFEIPLNIPNVSTQTKSNQNDIVEFGKSSENGNVVLPHLSTAAKQTITKNIISGFSETDQSSSMVHIPLPEQKQATPVETIDYGTGYNDCMKPVIPELSAPRFQRNNTTPSSLNIERDQGEEVLQPEEKFQRQFKKKTQYIVDRTDRYKETPERPSMMPKTMYKYGSQK